MISDPQLKLRWWAECGNEYCILTKGVDDQPWKEDPVDIEDDSNDNQAVADDDNEHPKPYVEPVRNMHVQNINILLRQNRKLLPKNNY